MDRGSDSEKFATQLTRLLHGVRTRRRLIVCDWDLVIRQARSAGLLARLAVDLEDAGLIDAVPPQPRRHLAADRCLAERHDRDVRWEVQCVERALGGLEIPVVLLKGAAYVMGGLPPARGRSFTDIDIMVPFESIDRVEAALKEAGWRPADLAPYDQSYYRRWMHQIPPMLHAKRDTLIDVHHTIVARTTRLKLQPNSLFVRAVKLDNGGAFRILSPADMVLHSAAHLLNQGDFDRGLRDLDDLNLLLQHFGADESFWPVLVDRAAELDLNRPLYYALRYTSRLLGTQVPTTAVNSLRRVGPKDMQRAVMDVLFEHALRPAHSTCRNAFSGLALWLLYVRAHYLLMPVHILIPHVVRKAVTARKSLSH